VTEVLLVVNPIAGSRGEAVRLAEELSSALRGRGHSVEVFTTKAKGDAFLRASEEDVGRFGVVCALGGDGTLNEVINGVIEKDIAVLPVPVGLSNVLARQMSATRDVTRIVELLESGKTYTIDLIEASFEGRRRCAVAMAGAGFDADVVTRIARSRSSHLGFPGYVPPIACSLLSRSRPFRIVADGIEVTSRATYLVVGNVRYYGGPFHITVKASPRDGKMDILYGEGLSPTGVILFYCSVLTGTHLRHRGIHYLQCRRLEVRPAGKEAARLHIDGEAVGSIPCSFKVLPRRLRLVVPLEEEGSGEEIRS